MPYRVIEHHDEQGRLAHPYVSFHPAEKGSQAVSHTYSYLWARENIYRQVGTPGLEDDDSTRIFTKKEIARILGED